MPSFPRTRTVPFLDISEFLGLTRRASPSREDRQKIQRWASLLLEHSIKQFGAIHTAVIDERLQTIAKCHPNFVDVIQWISDELTFAHAAGEGLSFVRLLLVGPAGSGKTAFSLELADALALPVDVVCMNNLQTSAALSGSERHWANSEPGAVFRLLTGSHIINPVMVLDEIDKARPLNGYDPLNALYTLLECRTAKRFSDVALPSVHFDASHINWIATANSTEMLGTALRSRFTVFPIRKLHRDEMTELITRMYRDLLDAYPAVSARMKSELPSEVTESLLSLLESGRDIDRLLKMLVGRALKSGQSIVSVQHIPNLRNSRRPTIGFV